MSETRRTRVPNSVGICLREVVDERHQRVDHDDELRARLDRDVEVGGRDDAAVDQLAVLDLGGLVDHRQRGRGAHGGGDRDVVPALGAEHDPLAGVEVGRREVELVLEQAEVVGAVGVARAPCGRTPRSPSPCRCPTAARRRARSRGRPARTSRGCGRARARRRAACSGSLSRLGRELAVVRPQQHVRG